MQSVSWTRILELLSLSSSLLASWIFIFYLIKSQKKEREALIDRLMAKDYNQYKQFDSVPQKSFTNGNKMMKPILPMTDEELYWLEQKKNKELAEKSINA